MGKTLDRGDELKYPPGFAEALGRTIKVIRTDRGLERRDLAKAVGISYSYLTEIENGNKPPSSSVLGPIAHALGLRMFQLIEAAETRMESQRADYVSAESTASGQMGEPAGPAAAAPGQPAAQRDLEDQSAPARSPRQSRAVFEQPYAMQPSLRGPNRDIRAAVIELERLLRGMAREDIERLLDFARRLAR
jgi:transcriptional regulator with XRE-family HTH domain